MINNEKPLGKHGMGRKGHFVAFGEKSKIATIIFLVIICLWSVFRFISFVIFEKSNSAAYNFGHLLGYVGIIGISGLWIYWLWKELKERKSKKKRR